MNSFAKFAKFILLALVIIMKILSTDEVHASEQVVLDTLSNGLTVLIKRDSGSGVVAIVTRVEVGYFNEADSLTGISHLLEHMFFKGTPSRPVGEIGRQTKAAGGYLNGSTGYEYTSYYTVVPKESFDAAIEIQADALLNCTIDSAELAKEAQVVIQEIKRKFDNPTAFSYEKLLELAFEKHNLRRWRMGIPEQVAGWSRKTLLEHYKKYYSPQNIIISIVGDIDPNSAMAKVKALYEKMPASKLEPEPSPAEPPQKGLKYKRIEADLSRNIVQLGFHVPGGLDEDHFSLVVLEQLLSSGRASRLYRKIKEEKGLAEAITCSYDWYKDTGYFTFTAEQNSGSTESLFTSILFEIERLKIEKPGKNELNRVLNQLETSYYRRLEDAVNQAQNLAMFQAYGDYRDADKYIAMLRQVTAEDIVKVANKYFALDNSAILEYLPKDVSSETLSAEILNTRLSKAIDDFRQTCRQSPEEIPLIVACRPVGGEKYPDQPVVDIELGNGIHLICRERHSLPLVTVQVNFPGGRLDETMNDAGITELMLRSSMKGAGRLDAATIAGDLEGLGARIDYLAEPDYFGYSLDAMSANFEEAMAIFAQVILNPSFPENEIEIEKSDMIASIARQKDSNADYPIELSQRALFAGTPYGLPSKGDPGAIAKIGRAELVNWHRRLVTTGGCEVVFVGDIRAEEATAIAKKYFRNLSVARKKDRTKTIEIKPKILTLQEKRERAQTAQAIGFLTCPASHPDYLVLKVIQGIVGGMGGRLWENIRDRNSLAYSVYAYQEPKLLAGNFTCYLATSPENAVAARSMVNDIMKNLANSEVAKSELEMAKDYVAGTFRIALQSNSALASIYSRWQMVGRGAMAVDTYPDEVRTVTSDDIKRVAKKYFASSKYALGLVEGELSPKK